MYLVNRNTDLQQKSSISHNICEDHDHFHHWQDMFLVKEDHSIVALMFCKVINLEVLVNSKDVSALMLIQKV